MNPRPFHAVRWLFAQIFVFVLVLFPVFFIAYGLHQALLFLISSGPGVHALLAVAIFVTIFMWRFLFRSSN